jgi:hypothetical protein
MTTVEITETVQDGVLKAVETSQRWTLEAFRAAATSVDSVFPERPAVPFADRFPSPQEAIDVSFSFFEKLLEAQHSFLNELATITVPQTSAK